MFYAEHRNTRRIATAQLLIQQQTPLQSEQEHSVTIHFLPLI